MSGTGGRRAFGPPLFNARIRSFPGYFQVTENLAIEFSGDGEHDYLYIEKTGANTTWVAEHLARFAGITVRDVGYSGLKDRHAVTRQWFSVRAAPRADWASFSAPGIRVLEMQRHRRKLRRGSHRSNSFRIALLSTAVAGREAELAERLAQVQSSGVPNYFGPQRFGRQGGNLALAERLFAGEALSRKKRGFAISAARSLLFNAILDTRVTQGTWNRLVPGDLANLDGSGSVFAVDAVDKTLEHRVREHDIHPSATLWGLGAPRTAGAAAGIERAAVAGLHAFAEGLEAAGIAAGTRALRLPVEALHWHVEPDVVWLDFTLRRGGFATAVLREIADVDEGVTPRPAQSGRV